MFDLRMFAFTVGLCNFFSCVKIFNGVNFFKHINAFVNVLILQPYKIVIVRPPFGWTRNNVSYSSIHPFVHYRTCEHFWQRMNQFRCKLTDVVRATMAWNVQLWGSGGQRSRSQEAEIHDICEHIFRKIEPILLQIGMSGPWSKGMKRSFYWGQEVKVKVTGGWS